MERMMTQVEVLSLSAPERRRRRMVLLMFVLALFALVAFVIIPKQHDKATFGFVMDREWVAFHEWSINSRHGSLGFAILGLIAAILALFQYRARKTIRIASALFGVSFLMSFLCWAASGKFIPLTGLLQGGLLLAVPLIYGAMAGVLCERSLPEFSRV
jgi:MFS family permease